MTSRRTVLKTALLGVAGLGLGCAPLEPRRRGAADPAAEAFLDDLQRRTFRYFWETTNPANGLAHDRYPRRSFASMAAVGFALTAYPIGVQRRYVDRGRGRRAGARDPALPRRCAAGRRPDRHDRASRLLLPFRRHGAGPALRADRIVDRRHRLAARRHAVLPGLFRPAGRARDRRAGRSHLCAGRLALGAAARAADLARLEPGGRFPPL